MSHEDKPTVMAYEVHERENAKRLTCAHIKQVLQVQPQEDTAARSAPAIY